MTISFCGASPSLSPPSTSCAEQTSETERWKPVVGYEGIYEVSSTGRVKRLTSHNPAHVGLILSQRQNPIGYMLVNLSKNDEPETKRIHQLVTGAFLGSPPVNMVVNHIDGNKCNNLLANLEYVTRKRNIVHALETGLLKRKLSHDDVRKIRELRGTMRNEDIGKLFGIRKNTVSRIHCNKYWYYIE